MQYSYFKLLLLLPLLHWLHNCCQLHPCGFPSPLCGTVTAAAPGWEPLSASTTGLDEPKVLTQNLHFYAKLAGEMHSETFRHLWDRKEH